MERVKRRKPIADEFSCEVFDSRGLAPQFCRPEEGQSTGGIYADYSQRRAQERQQRIFSRWHLLPNWGCPVLVDISRITFRFNVFVQRITEVVGGEDEIWVLESGMRNQLHIWRSES